MSRERMVPKGCIEEEDRLSNLHHSIICHILSFLPTKFAAATSILSTKWSYIFLSVPKIDLDDSLLLHPPQRKQIPYKRSQVQTQSQPEWLEKYINFVFRLVMLWESYSVSEFRLHSQNISTSYLASVWISFMLWRDIQVLDIAIGLGENENSAVLPSEIFWCKTLVVLKLCGGALVKFPNIFCLPKLKVLHIELLKVLGSDTSLRYGQGRVVDPEDAWTNAVRPRTYKVGSVEISILSLEKLIWRPFWGMDKVVLNTPNLQVLEYDDSYSKVQSTCGFKSLVRAEFSPGMPPVLSRLQLFSFISKMCNVKFLRLSGASLEVLFRSPHSLPEFHNLRRMELKASRDYQWQLLEILLHCAPNLEMLICDLHCEVYTQTALDYGAQEKPVCFAKHLREIEIRNFSGHKLEFELVRYLLQQAAVLDVMSMSPLEYGMSKGWPPKKLLKGSKCSKNCNIVFKGKTSLANTWINPFHCFLQSLIC